MWAMTRWGRRAALLLVVLLQLAGPRAGSRDEDAMQPVLGGAAGVGQLALLLRVRQRPVLVAVAVLALYAAQVLTLDVVPPAACWFALWCLVTYAADARRAVRHATAYMSAVVAVVGTGELLYPGTGGGPLFMAVTVALGLVALLRRSERSRLAAVRAEAASAERLRIAADLHDLAGHGLGVVAVQSSTARMALEAGDQETARRALGAVEASSRSALKEMRLLLTVLRGPGDAEAAPLPGLADIAGLVGGLADGGVRITADVTTEPVPVDVQLAAYRVVQEALTNAVRHAPGSSVDVGVRADAGSLLVDVVSRGAAAPTPGGGTGLDGIRARVAAAGGTVQAGPTTDGWAVRAVLPLVAA